MRGQWSDPTSPKLFLKETPKEQYVPLQTLSCFLSSDSLLDNLVLSFTEPSLKISPNPTPRIFFGCAGPNAGSLPFPGEVTGEVGLLKTGSEDKMRKGKLF